MIPDVAIRSVSWKRVGIFYGIAGAGVIVVAIVVAATGTSWGSGLATLMFGGLAMTMPLIAGPGALATVVLLASRNSGDLPALVGINLVMLSVLALTYLLFRVSHHVERALGATGIVVLTRLFGILLAALSVQFVLDGLRDYGFLPA